MQSAKPTTKKSVVAITKGGRWEAKKLIKESLDLIGGINTVVKKGDTVLLKPNLGYPEPPGMPPWTCTTDLLVLAALTELCFEAGAKRVVTGDGCAHDIEGSYMFQSTGIQEAVEKVGGEVIDFFEEPHLTVEVPGGILLRKQALPKIVLDADKIINVPKIKPTRVGNKFTLGVKNMFGVIPHTERLPWHRMPEFVFLLTDLMKVVKPALTVTDGLIIQEGNGPRFGDVVDLGVIITGIDPIATEAVTMLVVGHEPHEQPVLAIAEKYGIGTSDMEQIEVRGKSIESVRRYCKLAPYSFAHPSPNVVEYVGGACEGGGCGLWLQYTPYPWEIDKKKKYAVIIGQTPRLPEKFTEDEVIIMGTCAIQSKAKISRACREGVTPQIITGCPPYEKRRPGYLKLHQIEHLPYSHKINYVKE